MKIKIEIKPSLDFERNIEISDEIEDGKYVIKYKIKSFNPEEAKEKFIYISKHEWNKIVNIKHYG